MKNVLNQGALNANRQGRLAPLQYSALLLYILVGGLLFILGAGLAWAMISNLYNFLVTHVLQKSTNTDLFSLLGGLVFSLAFGALGIWLIWMAWMSSRKTIIDLVTGKVIYIDGSSRKHKEAKTNGRGNLLYYSVGEMAFQIPASTTWNALPEESRVRAYYTPNSATFVNVEVLISGPK